MFEHLITDPEIYDVCADLFSSGHYNISVAESFKAVDRYIADRIPALDKKGTTLMEQVFSPSSPYLTWSDMNSISQLDEQKGYHRLYSGAMLAIRNPTTHEFGWVSEPENALELIIFAQHLLRKAKSAQIKKVESKDLVSSQ